MDPQHRPGDDAERSIMRTALHEAGRGPRGANPLVGAVLVDGSGRVLHAGHHRGAGTVHAEVDVLERAASAGTDLHGTTMYVTLEPCNHWGRTGPCAEAIVEAGVPRVVYGAPDRTAAAAGGAATMRAAGLQVRGGVLARETELLNDRWGETMRAQRPFVSLKVAQTLDARIAAADGTSRWITSSSAREHGHDVRALADAVLVGTGTVLADDPRLTARTGDGGAVPRQPLRVAMGLRPVPARAAMRGTDGRFRHVTTHDPHSALAELYDAGVRHVLVEGGATVAAGFLRAGLVDEIHLYQAPLLLGAGRPAFADLGVGTLAEAARWRLDPTGDGPVRQLGPDLWVHLRPEPER
ncbi:bifunctional diaminohydroxyphosphoribosylaminopyrimidine deaminase/5-amino-6-(5-phosphoribosylamino)uracil reductase RibD [Kocuria sp. M1R5S2]|uniref:bifunctional diaminohydroxyphosphoribosylaminopyrimidine deaminase/5-amino-6-(5-phosphoribosylamino)uracil reductase RibD n=1 Tax=Kocuria rhizosphaerae TaxID=3376285 RepID=UPI0037B8A185